MSTTPSQQNKAVMLWLQGMLLLVLVASIGCASSSLPKRYSRAEPNVLCDIYEYDIKELPAEVATNHPPHAYIKGVREQDVITTSVARIYTNCTFRFSWNRGTIERPQYVSKSGRLPDEIRFRLEREFAQNKPKLGMKPPVFRFSGITISLGHIRGPASAIMTQGYLQARYVRSLSEQEAMANQKVMIEWDDEIYRLRHQPAP